MIDVQEIINEAVQRSYQTHGSSGNPKFHVSDAGTCYRKRYFKRLGVDSSIEIPVASLRKMFAGDAGHLHLQNLLNTNGKLFANEGTVENEHVKGRFDGVIKDGAAKTLLEVKTIEKWAMGYIKKDGPKPEHVLQMFTYWSFMRNDYTHLDQATLFYVKREDFEGRAFNFVWDDDIAQQVAKEWLPLIEYWDKQKVPPCTCHEDFGGKGVQYCRFANEDKTECCSLDLLTQFDKNKEKELENAKI